MYQLLFRNRWIALIWAVATMISIATFVSEGGGTDKLGKTAEDVRTRHDSVAVGEKPAKFAEENLEDDAELVDPATGYDPTPLDELAPETAPKLVRSGIVEDAVPTE